MTLTANTLNRTLKLELDYGGAKNEADAARIVQQYVLQILVGADVATSKTRQATLLTVVNAGSRAFLGGVHVKMADDFAVATPWDRGRQATEVLSEFDNVEFVDELMADRPVVVIGDAFWDGALPIYTTWEGWAGGVVTTPAERLAEDAEFALSGVLSGGLAVSEAFQWVRGYKVAAARPVGLSLWRPDSEWRRPDATGDTLRYLPDNAWLLGLGHLGMAYAWAFGFLPFDAATRGSVNVMLQDVEEVVDANEATSMLVRQGQRGLKTRVVERQLGALGFRVRVTDRLFDEHTRRSDAPETPEPRLALAGFDSNGPRRLLDDPGFLYVVDAGLGVGRHEYLGISLHTFPASRKAKDVFPHTLPVEVPDALHRSAYDAAARASVTRGEAQSLEEAKCGLIDVAGKAAGAAFVGTVAATLVISELLRVVNRGTRYEAVSINLRSPEMMTARPSSNQKPYNPGFVVADLS